MTDERPPVSRLADAVLYGPLGLALEGRRLLPDLADRGRRQVQFTRVVGKYAVRRGEERLHQTWGDAQGLVLGIFALVGVGGEQDADESPVSTATPPPTTNGTSPQKQPPGPSRAESGALAIPGYDSLSAFQVMPRLEGLGIDELEAVRAYERETRARQTILNKIAQLQAS